MSNPYYIAPSILAADMARLGAEVADVVAAGADYIHFDVMDNHYVPNLTFGTMVCQAIKPYASTALMDVHLMVEPVDDLIQGFIQAGADIISFHPEASRHIDRSLALIKSANKQAALALNPATPVYVIENVLDKLDMVLLMSVNPGFGGQKFIPNTINKIKQLRTILDNYAQTSGRHIRIEIDGGVTPDNIAQIAQAGADTFVAGSAIFGQPDYAQVIEKMRFNLKHTA